MNRLAEILVPNRVLSADDVATLRAALGTAPWEARQARLDARDNAIRAALAALAPLDRTNSARALERAWNRLKSGWSGESEFDALVQKIDRLNGDNRPLRFPQIVRIARGERTPP